MDQNVEMFDLKAICHLYQCLSFSTRIAKFDVEEIEIFV